MATVNEKLAAIQAEKVNIKNAIISKGIQVGDKLSEYSTAITNIPSGGGYGAITMWEGNKTYNSFVDASELHWVNRIGALLWKNASGKLIANNAGTMQDWNPYASGAAKSMPTAPAAGYSLLGVNVGLGIWVYYEETKTTNNLVWASEGSDRFNAFINGATHANGWDATTAILAVADIASDTLFSRIAVLKNTPNNLPVYLPAKTELLEMQNNCCADTHVEEGSCSYDNNIGTLLSLSGDGYWTSSQAISYGTDAFKIRFNSCTMSSDSKANNACKAILFLHF